jgi:hypothetical protein
MPPRCATFVVATAPQNQNFNLNALDFCSSYVPVKGMSDRPASWRVPTPKQMEKTRRQAQLTA